MLFSDFFKVLNIDTNNVSSFLLKKEISLLCEDSNKIKPNAIFFAKQGKQFNALDFVDYAKEINYVVFASSSNTKAKEFLNVKNIILVEDLTKTIKQAVANFYHLKPNHKLAITGTNGKSSIVCFIRQILFLLGKPSASVGTLGFFLNNKLIEETLTTPSYLDLARYEQSVKQQGVEFFALETSSHGLLQGRLGKSLVDIAGFINLSQDHLDYHKNMQNYYDAKKLLFTNFLNNPKKMAVNIDDSYGLKLTKELGLNKQDELITFGKQKSSVFYIKDIKTQGTYQAVKVVYLAKEYSFKLNILGEFQVYNILCAVAMILLTKSFEFKQIIAVLESVKAEKGRLELIAEYKNSKIYVDYAHTPSALEAALYSLQKNTKGKLHVVFGCGGNRDALKRPQMGKIAYSLANYIYITDDNPRHEEPSKIRQETASFASNIMVVKDIDGFNKKSLGNKNIFNIAGRKNAILFAISNLKEGDILLIAGKGHEQYQIIKNKKHNFSDYEVVHNAIKEIKK